MHWQCQFVDGKGKRCENEALYRLHFSNEHTFDHVDACEKHLEEYKHNVWIQDLSDKPRKGLVIL